MRHGDKKFRGQFKHNDAKDCKRKCCWTVFVCPQFICRGNSMIFWICPVVHCHAFCMWHWPIWIWLSAEVITICLLWVWKNSRPWADYFITCYTILSRHNNVEATVHGGNFWLSVWTQPCVIVYKKFASNRALYCCSEHFVETDY